MNNIYRVLWNEASGTYVAAPENARTGGASGASAVVQGAVEVAGAVSTKAGQVIWALLQPVAAALVSAGLVHAAGPAPDQLPAGGQVAAGSVSIRQNLGVMDIVQSSQRAAVNWQSFDVGSGARVNFSQPQASSVILNRVLGSTPSQIFGQINANGQVFLSNPNGVYFAPGSSVDVGALAATTHKISDADFMAGNYLLERQGATGSVVNQGTLSAQYGGYIALLAPEVRNQGVVLAKMGTVALAAGERYQLQIGSEGRLSNIVVTPATIAALVDNGNAVEAPGGLIILSAQAANRLQAGVVKNSGVLNATGLVSEGGTIRLVASDRVENTGRIAADAAPNSAGQGGRIELITDLTNPTGRADIAGGLSARGGSLGGDGGFIETSASNLVIADSAQVITSAPQGKFGTWLLDPTDFTISAGAGARTSSGIGATTLQDSLSRGNVSIATDNALGADNGDLTVDAPVSWSDNTTLSLSAYRHVNLNNAITASGTSGGLSVRSAVGGSGSINLAANMVTGGAQVYTGSLVLNADAMVQSTAAGISITGGIASGAASAFTLDSATASSVAGVISGTTALTKAGVGTLTLSGANSYSGNTRVAAGMLTFAGAGSLGGATKNNYNGTVDIASGATFRVNTSSQQSLYGVISGTGDFVIEKSVVQISAQNTYSGNIFIRSGNLKVAGGGVLGLANKVANYAGSMNIASGSGLWWQSSSNQIMSGVISGEGWVEVRNGSSSSAALTLNGDNTYSGGTFVGGTSTAPVKNFSGVLKAGSSTAFGTNTVKVWDGGVVFINGANHTVGGVLDLNGQTINNALILNGTGIDLGGALINSSAASATYAGLITLGSNASVLGKTGTINLTNLGAITGSGYGLTLGGAKGGSVASILGTDTGGLTKQDAGTWNLSGANTFTGGTTVSGGTLQITGSLGSGSYAGNIALSSGAVLKYSSGGPQTLSGTISGAGSLLRDSSNASTLTLSGSNTYTGGTTVSAGTLALGADNVFADTGAVTVSGTGTLSLGTYSDTVASVTLQGTGVISGSSGILTSASAYNLQAGSVSAILAGSAGANKTTAGTVTLSGANTYTGTTTVSGGILQIIGSLGSGSYAGNIALSSGAVLKYSSGGAQTLSGTISGAGSLLKDSNASTLTLSGSNTYTGGTTVSAGTLALGADNVFANTGAVTVNGTGTLSLGTYSDTVASVTLQGTGVISGSSGILTSTGAYNLQAGSVSAILAGGAGANKTTAGTVTLSGANTYSGTTTVSAGTLALGANDVLASGGAVKVSGTGTLNLNGYSDTVAGVSLQGTGSITGPGILTSASAYDLQAGSVSAILAGSAGANKTTAGTVTLSGANTYSGTTTVSAGALALGADNVFADTGAVTVNGTGTLSLGTYSDTVASVTLQGTGVISGSSGILTSTGAYNLQAGSVSAILAGSAGANKTTAGTVTLSGANTYSGITTVSAGTLSVKNAAALGNVADGTTIASGATLDIQAALIAEPIALNGGTITNSSTTRYSVTAPITMGANSTFAAPAGELVFGGSVSANGNYSLTKTGVGRIGMGADFNNWGDTVITGGTLYFGGRATLGTTQRYIGVYSGSIFISSGSFFGYSSNGAQTLSGEISGGGSVTKASLSSTLTLSGANTYTGGTVISAGTLKLASATALGDVTGSVSLITGGALDLNGQTIAYAKPLTLNGTGVSSGGALLNSSDTAASYAGLVTLGSDTSIVAGGGKISLTNVDTISSSNYSLTLGGAAGGSVTSILGLGSGTLTKQDAGTWTLLGVNTYTGGTTVSAGTLQISGSLGSGNYVGNVALASGAVLEYSSGGAQTLSGTISGAGSLLKDSSNASTLTLSGSNTYTGGTTVSAGTLALGADNVFADTGAVTVSGTGTLSLGTYSDTVASVTLQYTGVISGSTGILTSASAYDLQAGSVSAILAGSAGANKTTAGTVTLSGANTYSGTTTVSAGTLALGANDVLASGGAVKVSGTGTLNLNGYSDTVAGVSLQGTGSITGPGILTSASAYDLQAGSVSAILAGSAGANKTTAGTVTLSGANTYSGTTTVSAGTLRVGNSRALSTGAVAVGSSASSAASLDLYGNEVGNALTLYGYGSAGEGGTVGALTNSSATAATASGSVVLGSATSLGGSGAITVSGAITSNANGLVLLGTGADMLSNTANTLSTLASGSGVGSVAVNNGSALTLGSVSLGATRYDGIASSGAVSVGTTVGNLTVTRAVSAGSSLVLGAGSDTAAGTRTGGDVILSGTPSLSGTSAKIYTGSLAGSSGVVMAVGSGSGNFRYNSSQTDTNYSLALGTGLQAIYREQPTYFIAANSAADITYGASAPAYTFTGLGQNGDTAVQALGLRAAVADDGLKSGAGKLTAGSHTLSVTGAVNQLGYALTYSANTLTVNRATLTVSGLTAANKIYDGNTRAPLGGTVTFTALGGDNVTVGGVAVGAFADNLVGTGKLVTVSGNTLGGADAANYRVVQQSGLRADITPSIPQDVFLVSKMTNTAVCSTAPLADFSMSGGTTSAQADAPKDAAAKPASASKASLASGCS